MKTIILLMLFLPLASVANEKECAEIANITMTQAIGRAAVEEATNGSEFESWRMLWIIASEDFEKSKVRAKRQKIISKEISSIDSISGNFEADAFLIGDFYYAYCMTPKKNRRYKSLLKVDKKKLANCWHNRPENEENGSRKCVVNLVAKP